MSGTVGVRVGIREPGGLLPGLFVVGRIVLEERHDVPVLPRDAIRYEGKRPYILYVDGEEKARRREITIGLSDNDVVEILSFGSGAEPPVRIIVLGNVTEGKFVSVSETEKSAVSTPPATAGARPAPGTKS
jgi:hypothetical protein